MDEKVRENKGKQFKGNREEREALPRCKSTKGDESRGREVSMNFAVAYTLRMLHGMLTLSSKGVSWSVRLRFWAQRETQHATRDWSHKRENMKPEVLPY